MPHTLSPIKTKRLDEKQSLQTLNVRLQNYVNRMKDLEDSKSILEEESETIRVRYQKELDATKQRLTKELEDSRKELEFEIDQKSRLQVLEQEQHTELVKLRAQVKELVDAKLVADRLHVELEKERSIAKNAKETLATQTTELQSARRKINSLDKECRATKSQLSDALNELEQLKTKNESFYLGRDKQISDMRKEISQKYQEELAERKKEADERLLNAEKECRSHFENMIEGLKVQIHDLTTENENTKSELDRTALDYDESLKVRQSLADKLSHLEKEYREDRKKWKEERRSYEAVVEKSRQIRVQKETEFNDLMDIKIALDSEITMYRSILDREENRVGISTPTPKSNKRKLQAKSSKSSKKARKVSSSIKIHTLDLEDEKIILENVSENDVSLKGWRICSKAEKQTFGFPDSYVLKGKSKVCVISGKKNKPQKNSENTLNMDKFWTKKFIWNTSGDMAILKNENGIPVCRVCEGEQADFSNSDLDEMSNEDGSCSIM